MARFMFAILAALTLLVPVQVEAQVIQYFFVPVYVTPDGVRGPAHIRWDYPGGVANPDGIVVDRWSCKDYGSVNNVMVCAVGADAAVLAQLEAEADVYTWPTALDENMTAQERSAVETYLEAQYIPANWLSPSDTRRTALRTVLGMYFYMQRLTAMSGENPITDWGITLNTQFRNLTTQQQAWLEDAASSLGYTWDVSSNNTIRIILKGMADEWGDLPVYFGFVTL